MMRFVTNVAFAVITILIVTALFLGIFDEHHRDLEHTEVEPVRIVHLLRFPMKRLSEAVCGATPY